MDITILKPSDITYLEKLLLDRNGNLKVVPYQYLKDVPQNDISLFCVKYGFYSVPTIELLLFLTKEINGKNDETMEIGAGNGAISRALGIRAVDNYMQASPDIKAYYETLKQATVPYGEHVEKIDANSAVLRYKPSIVIGAYITHLYNAKEHWRGGNMYGVDEKKMLRKVDKYIHIGNESVHGKKPLLRSKPRVVKEEWIVSRSLKTNENVIWIWEN